MWNRVSSLACKFPGRAECRCVYFALHFLVEISRESGVSGD